MQRSLKNFVRLVALALVMLMLSSCEGCNFSELFNIVVPEETDENGNPITPDGSYTNSDGQSGLVDDSTDDPTEAPTEEVIVQYDAAMEEEIRQAYAHVYIDKESVKVENMEIQFLGQVGNTYCVHVVDTSARGNLGAYDIAGYEFRYLFGRRINVFHKGQLYPLADAYEKGIVTKEDVAVFNAKFRELNAENYKSIYPESNIREDTVDLMIMGRIAVRIQPAYNSKKYTVEDFADVGCISIENKSSSGDSHEIYKRYLIYLSDDVDTPEEMLAIVRKLEARDDIYLASIQFTGRTDSIPSDGEYMSWVGDYWAINKISLPDAWDIETGDSTVLVGVIDTGIDATHPDLMNRVNTTLSDSFTLHESAADSLQDPAGHGTMVAGIIGAEANNGTGVSGVCWNVQLVSLKANLQGNSSNLDEESVISALFAADALGIPIVNLSGSFSDRNNDLRLAILGYDGLVVCSAGNWNFNLNVDPAEGNVNLVYPASFSDCDNLLVVGASTENDMRKEGTSYGAISVDLFAPGVNILTTFPTALCNAGCGEDHNVPVNNYDGVHYAGYHYFQNTSAATPFVTGVAALVLAQNPTFTAEDIKARILDTVDEVDALDGRCVTGGRLNAFKAVHATHTYTDHYSLFNSSFHYAYCECGAYTTQRHTGSARCTKCGYTSGGIIPTPGLSKDDEEETE
ncbi:MAG: S8 family serine peptidase [Clostridia bacterium]|nr:S8 family serine peptidase [Clostridia bacterium]